MLTILYIILIAALWRLGGWDKAKWAGYRDVLVPVAMMIWFGATYNWWVGVLTGAAFNIIHVGYGAYDPEHDDKPSFIGGLLKDREGSLTRAIVGAMYALGALPVAIYTSEYMNMLWYALAISIPSFVLSKLKARDIIIEPIIGALVASVIFWFKP